MLKFQQEQQSPLIAGSGQSDLSNDSQTPAVSGQDEFLTVGSRDKAVKKGTIILAVLFFAGLGGLFLMIKKSTPAAATAAETTQKNAMQAAIAKITGIKKEIAGDAQNGLIYELSNVEKKQIKVGELRKNPFMLDKASGEKNPVASSDDSGMNEVAPARRVETQINGLKLLGIMLSPNGNSAMINDRIVYKGDKVSGYQVLAINEDSVDLTSQGTTVTLRISSGK